MKSIAWIPCVLLLLAGCAASLPKEPESAGRSVIDHPPKIFGVYEMDIAAERLSATYAEAVKSSIAAGRYIENLAFIAANAESCLQSRSYRIKGKELEHKKLQELRSRNVNVSQIVEYERLAKGYVLRPNGLEMFSCDHAGIPGAAASRY